MQLTLRSEEIGKTKAWLLLEQGDLAVKRYELMASIAVIPSASAELFRCDARLWLRNRSRAPAPPLSLWKWMWLKTKSPIWRS